MSVNLDKPISPKSAALVSLLLCVPFLFTFTTAVTGFKPLINLIASGGQATPFGSILFYIGLIGLPLAFVVNFIAMLSAQLTFAKWSVEGKISFHPTPVNLIIGGISLCVVAVFGGHL